MWRADRAPGSARPHRKRWPAVRRSQTGGRSRGTGAQASISVRCSQMGVALCRSAGSGCTSFVCVCPPSPRSASPGLGPCCTSRGRRPHRPRSPVALRCAKVGCSAMQWKPATPPLVASSQFISWSGTYLKRRSTVHTCRAERACLSSAQATTAVLVRGSVWFCGLCASVLSGLRRDNALFWKPCPFSSYSRTRQRQRKGPEGTPALLNGARPDAVDLWGDVNCNESLGQFRSGCRTCSMQPARVVVCCCVVLFQSVDATSRPPPPLSCDRGWPSGDQENPQKRARKAGENFLGGGAIGANGANMYLKIISVTWRSC